MAHQGVSEGALLAFLDPHVPLLLALLVVAIVFFARWQETADRSAYAIGSAAAILVPLWILGRLTVVFFPGGHDILPAGTDDLPIATWIVVWAYWVLGLVVLLAVLWFTLRPMWLTGLFLAAPQSEVRRRFKSLESNWQFAVAGLLVAKGLVLVFALVEPWL